MANTERMRLRKEILELQFARVEALDKIAEKRAELKLLSEKKKEKNG